MANLDQNVYHDSSKVKPYCLDNGSSMYKFDHFRVELNDSFSSRINEFLFYSKKDPKPSWYLSKSLGKVLMKLKKL